MVLKKSARRLSLWHQAIIMLLATFALSWQVAVARENGIVMYEEDSALSHQLSLPLYHWWNATMSPRAEVVAIHGLTMHGRTFDALARTLAAQGIEVWAMDMRGYGRSASESHQYCTSEGDCRQKMDYNRSCDDLVRLLRCLKTQGNSVPVFAVGESLGSSMAIRLAASHPDLVDGLVLSSPAIKRQWFFDPYALADTALMVVNPKAQVDLMPFVRKYVSDDPNIVAEKESDPLLRRSMSAMELLASCLEVHKTAGLIPAISSDLPVLVIQGSADRCIKANAVMLLLSKLHSHDQTVKWFPQRGHILLETSYVKPDTMDAVVSWLNMHANSPLMQARHHRVDDVMAGGIPGVGPVYPASEFKQVPEGLQ
jgi:alpha-beta hydrolase superfamily lysophospholipase